jgi:hypothetical protein
MKLGAHLDFLWFFFVSYEWQLWLPSATLVSSEYVLILLCDVFVPTRESLDVCRQTYEYVVFFCMHECGDTANELVPHTIQRSEARCRL